jgi:rubrerythrin
MKENEVLEILKKAILLEKRGKAFYQKVAEQAKNGDVKDFFEKMAAEEDRHIKILSEQFKSYQADNKFIPNHYGEEHSDIASDVLTGALQDKIAAAGFQAAAISAAMSMEDRAVKLYSGRAKSATDPDEKSLYHWLAEWEGKHLNALAAADRKLTEAVWADNNFWPF